MRRITAALTATSLALAFLAVCLGSCLAPAGDPHACCPTEPAGITADTDACWLDVDGVAAFAGPTGQPSVCTLVVFLAPAPSRKPVVHLGGAPPVAASPPAVLRI